jgi:hypothetical protein
MKSRLCLIAALLASFSFASVAFADGNITASVRRGDLRITGETAEDQLLKITPTSTRYRYMLSASTGTTINGASYIFVDGVNGDIDIRMAATESVVIVSNGVFAQIEIFGNLNISTSSRDSSIIMLDTVVCYEHISVSTGRGNDAILMVRTGAQGTCTLRTGSGNDVVYPYQCIPDLELFLDSGSGDDMVLLDQTRSSVITLRGAGGNDVLAYQNVLRSYPPNSIAYDGGAGIDQNFHNSPDPATSRRVEEASAGDFDDLIVMALSNDTFYRAAMLWAVLGLDS